jgi:hypothetical protein
MARQTLLTLFSSLLIIGIYVGIIIFGVRHVHQVRENTIATASMRATAAISPVLSKQAGDVALLKNTVSDDLRLFDARLTKLESTPPPAVVVPNTYYPVRESLSYCAATNENNTILLRCKNDLWSVNG